MAFYFGDESSNTKALGSAADLMFGFGGTIDYRGMEAMMSSTEATATIPSAAVTATTSSLVVMERIG